MKTTEKVKNLLNKTIDINDVEKVIYSTFAILIFLMPIIPEILNVGIYSLKCTLFNVITIITLFCIIVLNIYKLYEDNKEKNFIKVIKDLKINLNFINILIITYFILVIISCLFTKYGIFNAFLGLNGRGEGVLTIFSYLITFYIFKQGYNYIKDLGRIAIFGAIVVSIYSIIQANLPNGFSEPFTSLHLKSVATGTMRNQNFLSSYICIFLPMLCYIFIATKKYITLLPISMLFCALVFSKTLGGYITCICMFLLIAMFTIIYYKPRIKTLLSILIIVILAILLFTAITVEKKDTTYLNELSSTKQEIIKLSTNDQSFGSSRLAIWEKALMIIKNHPLIGIGPDSMAEELCNTDIYLTKGKRDMLNYFIIDKAHSEFLHIAVTTGLPSQIIYLIIVTTISLRLFIIILKNLIKNLKEHTTINKDQIFITAIFISIISYLMQSAINISVVQVAPIFWALLGIGCEITEDYKN